MFRNQKLAGPLIYGLIVGTLVLALVPVLLPGLFYLSVLTEIFVYAVIAQMWNMSAGYCGIYSFGNAAFIGLGAYATAFLAGRLNPVLAIFVGGIIAALYAAGLGAATLPKLGFMTFSIVSYAGAQILELLILYLTRMSYMLYIPAYSWNTIAFSYYVLLALTAFSILVSYVVSRSRFGLRLRAIRDDEDAAKALGINATLNKVTIFGMSGFVTALAGGFYALYLGVISPPGLFDVTFSLQGALQSLLGGLGTVVGPILGTAIIMVLDHYSRIAIPLLREFIMGAFLMGVVLLLPQGIIPTLQARMRKKQTIVKE